LIIVALLFYFVGTNNIPWRFYCERLERNPIADLPHKELKRITSPDGAVDAILARVETDSLSADGFAVYLAPTGKELDLQSLEFDRKYFTQTELMTLNLFGVSQVFLRLDILAATFSIFAIIGGCARITLLKCESFQKANLFPYQNEVW
jgi:hypothetical protein